ncbi:Asp-tRNA(Asn)/Glu-tRNA(Gln) amidotransferase subunit GatC [Halocatena pleomorpha]|uniref:Aspartyl/glutamyl-tRNA(Asn/Gln) amidotransferase subunit C n=1 Tax=Halocatena pleomorpha TaxID=1785090 RepID=A0A3P3RJR1_9EURY|nr:Asp-tRNA(Asn)/Glu-tRNA(Gln) amidotransferase subunit GatC [Halocatena pleomorpha]RRJ33564.1 Asp-tRNA(Asn)/Glu-tRNA(Gln) amidotransferase subunit GatC [Halocatena pleomorpha]
MSEDAVDADAVHHVADLARVALTESEAERFEAQFEDILDYFDSLDEVPEIERESDLVNVMRPDEQRPSLDQNEALDNAAETEDGYFKGPRVS